MHLLEREQAELARFIRRNEGFRADRLEIPGEILATGDAVPAAAVGLHQLDTPFHAVALEAGAPLPPLELDMFVYGGDAADAALAAGAPARPHTRATARAQLP